MQISFQNNNINFSARTKYPMIPKQEIVKCLNMGYSQARIGMKYDIPYYAVTRMVRSYRLNKVQKPKYAEPVHYAPKEDEILAEVSKKLNLSEEDLKKYLK